MKRIAILSAALCLAVLSGCGQRAAAMTKPEPSPWPTHAPEATPYVRPQAGQAPARAAEERTEEALSREEFLRSIYTFEGNFYFKDWEKELFEALPQDEPYAFVVHTEQFLQGNGGKQAHIALAEKFADAGCEAQVKEMRAVEDGREWTGWVTVVRTAPARLWELAHSMEQTLFVEQLYDSVDLRFDAVVWPEG